MTEFWFQLELRGTFNERIVKRSGPLGLRNLTPIDYILRGIYETTSLRRQTTLYHLEFNIYGHSSSTSPLIIFKHYWYKIIFLNKTNTIVINT